MSGALRHPAAQALVRPSPVVGTEANAREAGSLSRRRARAKTPAPLTKRHVRENRLRVIEVQDLVLLNVLWTR